MKAGLLALLITSLMVAGSALAQQKKAIEGDTKPKTEKQSSCTQALRQSPVTTTDIIPIITDLSAKPIKKDEYETSAQFKDRLKLRMQSIENDLQARYGHKKLIFEFPVDVKATRYDADKRQLLVDPGARLVKVNSSSTPAIILTPQTWAPGQSKVIEQQTVIAGTRVKENFRLDYGISAPPNADAFSWPSMLKAKPFEFSMSAEDAKNIRSELSILMAGSLAEPVFSSWRENAGANGKQGIFWIVPMILHVTYECAVLFDRRNNKQLRTLSVITSK